MIPSSPLIYNIIRLAGGDGASREGVEAQSCRSADHAQHIYGTGRGDFGVRALQDIALSGGYGRGIEFRHSNFTIRYSLGIHFHHPHLGGGILFFKTGHTHFSYRCLIIKNIL